jgi:G3E family GTPase
MIPVTLITGFLGSGKTTLLRRILDRPVMRNAAVLVNEFGEVGLDHRLLRRIDGETVVLENGCVCCSIRDDLVQVFRKLLLQRHRQEIPNFDRIAIESTGLADPVPVIHTLVSEPSLRHRFRLSNTITTVDVLQSKDIHSRYREWGKQITVADRVVLTKTDLAPEESIQVARRMVGTINPDAEVFDTARLDSDRIDALLTDSYEHANGPRRVPGWIAPSSEGNAVGGPQTHQHPKGPDGDTDGLPLASFTVTLKKPIDWTPFGIWLGLLLHAHGERILRVKGILNVLGSKGPIILQGVQHVIHAPYHLDYWPDENHHSRITFIVDGLSVKSIEASINAFIRRPGGS